jgi:hypothetical protein
MSFDCYFICLIRDDQNSTASEIKIYVEGTTFLEIFGRRQCGIRHQEGYGSGAQYSQRFTLPDKGREKKAVRHTLYSVTKSRPLVYQSFALN